MFYMAHCDNDEAFLKYFSERITTFLLKYFTQFQVKTFKDTDDFWNVYKSKPDFFQVIFLETDLKRENGLILGEKIRKLNKDVIIIYITSQDNYVYKAFTINAFRYIRKKKLEEELDECMEAVYKNLTQRERAYTFKVKEGRIKLKAREIMYFYFVNRHVEIHTSKGIYHTTVYRLKDIEEQLIEKYFMLIHRSCIMNVNYIQQVNGQEITLTNGEILTVSRYKLKEIQHVFTRKKSRVI